MVERSITGEHLIAELDRLAAQRGTFPTVLRCDNGPELACGAMADWQPARSGCTSSRPGSRGATATSNRSTPASATNASTSTGSGRWPSVTDHRAATLPPAFIDVRRNATRRITDEFFTAP